VVGLDSAERPYQRLILGELSFFPSGFWDWGTCGDPFSVTGEALHQCARKTFECNGLGKEMETNDAQAEQQ